MIIKSGIVVSIAQGVPGIVADILREAVRPMSIKEIADELDRLGYQHARPSTRQAASGALKKRKKHHRDVVNVGHGLWQYIQP